MGFEPTSLRDLAGRSNHLATGDSMVSKGEMWVFDWNCIALSHSQMMTRFIWTQIPSGTQVFFQVYVISTINVIKAKGKRTMFLSYF